MKKIMAIFMAVMLFILGGCSGNKETGSPTKVKEETQAENVAENTQENTEESEQTQESSTQDTPQAESQQTTAPENVEFGAVEPTVDEPIVSEDVELGDYTSKFLSRYVEDGSYYIVQNSIIDGVVTKVEIAVSGQKASEKVGTQVKIIDGEMLYYVIHDSKAILTSPVAMSMKEGFTDFISVKTSAEAESALQNTGEEEVQGEKFTFEEFKNADGTVAKYYYDDVTLRYVNIVKSDGNAELIQVEKISDTIPDDMFNIPDGYVVQDISKMQ